MTFGHYAPLHLSGLFSPQWMAMCLQARTKWEAIEELATLLFASGRIASVTEYLSAVRAREAQVSTGLGHGIAIPHGISSAVIQPSVALGRAVDGIEFEAIDGEPVTLIFLLAIPAHFSNTEYLETLSSLARLLVHEDFRLKLMVAASASEVLSVIQDSISHE